MIKIILKRCKWADKSGRLQQYHDMEWGVPEFNEQRLFADLSLEIFQAGLQWDLILKRRNAIYRAFDNFDYRKVARYSSLKFKLLLKDASIIRNRAKIRAIINNAKQLAKLHRSGITLKQLTWKPVHFVQLDHLITRTSLIDYSEFIKLFLVKFKGYNFQRIGPKTLYSYLQAAGVVNDHWLGCFRHDQVS